MLQTGMNKFIDSSDDSPTVLLLLLYALIVSSNDILNLVSVGRCQKIKLPFDIVPSRWEIYLNLGKQLSGEKLPTWIILEHRRMKERLVFETAFRRVARYSNKEMNKARYSNKPAKMVVRV